MLTSSRRNTARSKFPYIRLFLKALFTSAFFIFSHASNALQQDLCQPQNFDEIASVKQIVDGDTVRLFDGRLVRMAGINATELDHKSREHESYALKAREYLKQLVDGSIRLVYARDRHDRYGRLLAYAFDQNGVNLQERMLRSGLAFMVVIPPNTRFIECHTRAEGVARDRKLNLWSENGYIIQEAKRLRMHDTGFGIVRGKVSSVSRSRKSYWLELGRLTIRVAEKNARYFEHDIGFYEGKTVDVRGWIYRRKGLYVNVGHPLMLEIRK